MSCLWNGEPETPAWYTYTDLAGQTFTYKEQSADSAADGYEEDGQ